MSNVQKTSIESYRLLYDIGERQAEVLATVTELGAACSKDVSDCTNIPPNVVTPRIFELRELGIITESHRAKNPTTNRTSIYWKVAA